ncbi:MAG: hypothetical protein ABJ263_16840 [Tateyamaria sp.]|uniref:hypothetical protein n=1 Tax=Alphaproteobacteria TaxID=28211 RepID=UPI00328ECB25
MDYTADLHAASNCQRINQPSHAIQKKHDLAGPLSSLNTSAEIGILLQPSFNTIEYNTNGVVCMRHAENSDVPPQKPLFLACLILGVFLGLLGALCALIMGMEFLSILATYSAVGAATFLASAVTITLLNG